MSSGIQGREDPKGKISKITFHPNAVTMRLRIVKE